MYRRHSIIFLRYIIFRSDTGAQDNSRESRKGSKGAWSCIRTHDHGRFSFVLLRLSSNHVATLRISTADSPLFPVNAPTKSSAGRTPDCGQRNRDDNTDKGGLSWLKVRELPWIIQRRARSRRPWNLYEKRLHQSLFVSNNLNHISSFMLL